MEKPQLLIFANIAAITYEDPKTARTKFKAIGCTIVEFFDIDNAQAYLLKNNDGVHVISFRGTEVTEPSDILADLNPGNFFSTLSMYALRVVSTAALGILFAPIDPDIMLFYI